MKNITLPTFTTNVADIAKLIGQSDAVGQGARIYAAMAGLLNGDLRWGAERNNGKGGAIDVKPFSEAHGFDQGQTSKAVRVIIALIPDYADLSNDERTERVRSVIAEHSSLNAAWESVNQSQGAGNVKRGPKTAAELMLTAARAAHAAGIDYDEFLHLASVAFSDTAGE